MIDYDDLIKEIVTESDVLEWEAIGKELKLYVCSNCGFITSEPGITHNELPTDSMPSMCELSDWWHIRAKVMKDSEVTDGKTKNQ